MENYKAELTSLKEEFNSRIDAVIAKIENPKFELNKWNWCEFFNEGDENRWLVFITEISDKGEIYGYGFNYPIDKFYTWNSSMYLGVIKNMNKTWLATPKEVEEVLTKQCNQLGLIEGCDYLWEGIKRKAKGKLKMGWHDRPYAIYFTGSSGFVFDNGIFATPIKTKTIEEIAVELSNLLIEGKIKYLNENKQTLIETLNNL